MQVIVWRQGDKTLVTVPAFNVYKNTATGEFISLRPNEELPEGYEPATARDIALKDLPKGALFQILDETELPDAPQDAWVFNKKGKLIADPAISAELKIRYSIPDLVKRLSAIINSVPYNSVPVALRATIRQLQAGVRDALEAGDIEAGKFLIQNANIPEDLEQVRSLLIEEFNK